MGKIIGLTYDLKADWVGKPGDPPDINAELDKPQTIERVVQAFESAGHQVKKIGNLKNLLSRLDHLGVDIVFNICEGTSGRNRESQVPLLLEWKGIPYVGSDALTLGITLDKAVAKKMFMSEGIPTARFFAAAATEGLEKLNTIGYPLIVKTIHEGSSKGISRDSRVENLEALKRQVHLINTVYKQPALVEEFICGTEFTVAVLGNNPAQAMPVVQVSIDGDVNLGDEFYTFERISSSNLRYVCPAKISDGLTRQIQEIAVRAYTCVGCRDFGRVDFRVDTKGNPYVLEINPLPSLDPQDSFNIFPQVLGSTYDATLNKVLDFALQRYGLSDVKGTRTREEILLRPR
ncbi:MAG: ATP-grasp domain-containing protein [Candidatus Omnitrophica bacterium]|nr:ATP-grasp domain-containing protein [Candidatus Omnitrophota bacterium]